MLRKALLVAVLLSITSVLLVQPALAQTPTWIAYYFNNGTLEGTPFLTRQDPNVAFNWGVNPPISGMNADNFS